MDNKLKQLISSLNCDTGVQDFKGSFKAFKAGFWAMRKESVKEKLFFSAHLLSCQCEEDT